MKKEVILSASRIKTLETCSWSYWCNYILKVPQRKNEGAQRGTICHLVFELLLNKRHKKHFNTIMKRGHIKSSPAVNRLVVKHLKKEIIYSVENYNLCADMIFVGLNADFFGDKGRVDKPELKFLLESAGNGKLENFKFLEACLKIPDNAYASGDSWKWKDG